MTNGAEWAELEAKINTAIAAAVWIKIPVAPIFADSYEGNTAQWRIIALYDTKTRVCDGAAVNSASGLVVHLTRTQATEAVRLATKGPK